MVLWTILSDERRELGRAAMATLQWTKMTETLFYHLERRSLEEILPGLVEKSLQRGWRAAIKTDSAERSDALDTLLWTYDDQSFLPHAQRGDGKAEDQPVLITAEEGNPNSA